jgi:hypothetical protein
MPTVKKNLKSPPYMHQVHTPEPCSRPTAHRALRPLPVSNFEPVKSPACAALHQRPNPNQNTAVVAPGTNPRKPTQKFHPNRGCIVGIVVAGIGSKRTGQEPSKSWVFFFFCGLEDLDVVDWLQFPERFGDGFFLWSCSCSSEEG